MSSKLTGEQIAAAWKAWLASEQGQQCMDRATLALPDYLAKYLENRLWHAFMAGVKAAEVSEERPATKRPAPRMTPKPKNRHGRKGNSTPKGRGR